MKSSLKEEDISHPPYKGDGKRIMKQMTFIQWNF